MEKLKDWIDIIYKAGDRVHYYWRFSTWLNVLTIGWAFIVLVKLPELTMSAKSMITLFYLGGYLMSLGALLKSYTIYDLIISEAMKASKNKDAEILKKLDHTRLKNPRLIAIVMHTIYAVILLSLIWRPTFLIVIDG